MTRWDCLMLTVIINASLGWFNLSLGQNDNHSTKETNTNTKDNVCYFDESYEIHDGVCPANSTDVTDFGVFHGDHWIPISNSFGEENFDFKMADNVGNVYCELFNATGVREEIERLSLKGDSDLELCLQWKEYHENELQKHEDLLRHVSEKINVIQTELKEREANGNSNLTYGPFSKTDSKITYVEFSFYLNGSSKDVLIDLRDQTVVKLSLILERFDQEEEDIAMELRMLAFRLIEPLQSPSAGEWEKYDDTYEDEIEQPMPRSEKFVIRTVIKAVLILMLAIIALYILFL